MGQFGEILDDSRRLLKYVAASNVSLRNRVGALNQRVEWFDVYADTQFLDLCNH